MSADGTILPGGAADVLTYRPLAPSDVAALHRLASCRALVRQLGSWPRPPDRDFTASRCRPFERDVFVWAVVPAVDGAPLVGTVGITGRRGRGWLGYMFDISVAGGGIATRSVGEALTAARGRWETIEAVTWHDNPASRRILAKFDFVHWSTRYLRGRVRPGPALAFCHRRDGAAP